MTIKKKLDKAIPYIFTVVFMAVFFAAILVDHHNVSERAKRIERIKHLEEQVEQNKIYARESHELEQCKAKSEAAEFACRAEISDTITDCSSLLYSCYTQRDVWDICQYECVRIECLMEAGERGEFDTEEE